MGNKLVRVTMTKAPIKLLPCPFGCTERDLAVVQVSTLYEGKAVFGVACYGCKTIGPLALSKADAKRRWNQRTREVPHDRRA